MNLLPQDILQIHESLQLQTQFLCDIKEEFLSMNLQLHLSNLFIDSSWVLSVDTCLFSLETQKIFSAAASALAKVHGSVSQLQGWGLVKCR